MRARGFTLLELLVAMTLLSTLTAGGLAAMMRARAAALDAGVESRLHERAQYVFATLEPELQMAGYFAAGPARVALSPSTIPAPALACGLDTVRRLDHAVEVSAAFDLPCSAQGGGARSGSQLLLIRRIAAHGATGTPGRAQWWSDPLGMLPGQLSWDGTAPAGSPALAEVRDLLVRAYYIANAADGDTGTPALRVKNLTAIAGTPAFIDTEVMPGVDSLQAQLLPSASAPRSVLITLRVRADRQDQRNGEPPRQLTLTRQFTLRNAAT